jgi:hypothetical protein
MSSQELFFQEKNSTSYDYKKHLAGNKFSFKSKTGSNYELGYEHVFNEGVLI